MTEYQWKTVSVVGFDELMQALDRADRKGYMPDAIKEEWEAFNWKPEQPAPVQEPVAWVERWYGSGSDRGWWIWEAGLTHGNAIAYIGESDHAEQLASLIVEKHNAASHTPPAAQRQWVGLSEEEVLKLAYPIRWQEVDDFEADKAVNFGQMVEAKLKEKNNG